MRKIDYNNVAGMLRHAIRAQTLTATDETKPHIERQCARHAVEVLRALAQKYSERLSVDAHQFLKECGIER